MRIEHIGIGVSNPIQMGSWYRDNLGFRVLREAGNDSNGVMFLIDSANQVVLEIGRLANEPILDLEAIKPISFHLAIECENPVQEAERLVKAGARYIGDCPRNSYPGEKIFIRDPWGMGIQLLNRKEKL